MIDVKYIIVVMCDRSLKSAAEEERKIKMAGIYIMDGDLTAEFSRPIELIELSPFCHNHTKKNNFQVIK